MARKVLRICCCSNDLEQLKAKTAKGENAVNDDKF